MNSQEYEIQFFGFSAEQVSLERRYALKVMLHDLLKSVLDKMTCSEITGVMLIEQKSKIVTEIQKSFEEKLHEIEELDRKNFSIPKYVFLSDYYKGQPKKYTVDDEQQIDEEIACLKQLFLENSIMTAALEMENNQYELVEPLLKDEIEVHAQIQESLTTLNLDKCTEMVQEQKKFYH